MAHIHLEDGSFSLCWVIVWWAATIILIGISLYLLRSGKRTDHRKITIAAFCTASAFAIFQVAIPVAGGVHLNITPLVGILTGPAAGSLIVFVVNIMTAAIGHGGWSMIGANTLVNISEVLVAFSLFSLLGKITKSPFARAAIATFGGLVCGNIVMVGIIIISGVQGVTQSPAQILAGLSLVVAINFAVAVLEAIITGFVVTFIQKVRPDILGGKQKNSGR
jgi:cobalt/nickel transport system permease protein